MLGSSGQLEATVKSVHTIVTRSCAQPCLSQASRQAEARFVLSGMRPKMSPERSHSGTATSKPS